MLTHAKAKATAEYVKALCNRMKALYWDVEECLKHNSSLSIDWGAQEKPEYLNEDADGNLDGLDFDRASVSNAIGSLDAYRGLLDPDHLGNLEKLADADASQP